jgi:hypothetical protein
MIEKTELELLKERADIMAIDYHPSIGVKSLKAKMEEHGAMVLPAKLKSGGETIPMRNARLRKAAQKLVRVRITNMDPDKRNHPGEIISVSNSAIGVIKKFIPFKDADDGWHIPIVLLDVLRERKFQTFFTTKVNGKKVKRSRLAREFAIEILPELTITELSDLAKIQAIEGTLIE